MKKAFIAFFLVFLLFSVSAAGAKGEKSRLPGPCDMTAEEKALIRARGSMASSPVLDAALSLLEEGNPFMERYNIITGSFVQARMPYGVPYLYGGQAETHVFAKEPEYIVQEAWINSPIYYRAGVTYIYGFDCAGYVKWVWKQAGLGQLPGGQEMLNDGYRSFYHSVSREMPPFSELARTLRPWLPSPTAAWVYRCWVCRWNPRRATCSSRSRIPGTLTCQTIHGSPCCPGTRDKDTAGTDN